MFKHVFCIRARVNYSNNHGWMGWRRTCHCQLMLSIFNGMCGLYELQSCLNVHVVMHIGHPSRGTELHLLHLCHYFDQPFVSCAADVYWIVECFYCLLSQQANHATSKIFSKLPKYDPSFGTVMHSAIGACKQCCNSSVSTKSFSLSRCIVYELAAAPSL